MLKELYHCSECKKIVKGIDELFFVEDGSPRGFCSESCIEKYYSTIVKAFEDVIDIEKKKLDISSSGAESFHQDPHLVDKLLKNPDEIWKVENRLKEEYFVFIKKDDDTSAWLMAICFIFDFKPSFIISLESTKNEKFVECFRKGEKVIDLEPYKQLETESFLERDVLEEIEQKKSSLLAQLLEKRLDTDIAFENFGLYEDYFDTTLNDPDEMYSQVDEAGDEIVTCIKAHDKDGVSFYYFVLCIYVGEKMDNVDSTAIFPVLGFPSLDGDIYKFFQQGKKLSGQLRN